MENGPLAGMSYVGNQKCKFRHRVCVWGKCLPVKNIGIKKIRASFFLLMLCLNKIGVKMICYSMCPTKRTYGNEYNLQSK